MLEKHELEDSLPRIYEEATGRPYGGGRLDDAMSLGADEMALLRSICGDDLHFELTRELLDVERRHRSMGRRHGLFKAIDQAFRRGAFDSAEEAEATALERRDALSGVRTVALEPSLPLLVPRIAPGDGGAAA